ncbi:MAG: DUF5615 family PIN-like protein [Verrucomicrobia bacterium]|nr:DUF5615 family PIN-like protein [Verrucomicrobiota bacterium]
MQFLANENFAGDAVTALRERGHDVLWVRTTAPGIKDETVLAMARVHSRILLTFDKDFGELAFHARLPLPCGIILFRIPCRSPGYLARTTVKIIESRADWAGHFSVVEEGRLRMRPFPGL